MLIEHSFIHSFIILVQPLPFRYLYMTHTTGPYKTTTCRERESTLDHIHTSLTTQGHLRVSPDEWSRECRGPPLRQHKHERRYTPSTHPFILIRRIWKDDYTAKWYSGGLVSLKLPDIWLTGDWKPRKKTTPRKLVPIGNRTRSRCVTGAHATACSTAVDESIQNFNSTGPLGTEVWVFKLILLCKFQNVPCAVGFDVKHSTFFVEVSGHV